MTRISWREFWVQGPPAQTLCCAYQSTAGPLRLCFLEGRDRDRPNLTRCPAGRCGTFKRVLQMGGFMGSMDVPRVPRRPPSDIVPEPPVDDFDLWLDGQTTDSRGLRLASDRVEEFFQKHLTMLDDSLHFAIDGIESLDVSRMRSGLADRYGGTLDRLRKLRWRLSRWDWAAGKTLQLQFRDAADALFATDSPGLLPWSILNAVERLRNAAKTGVAVTQRCWSLRLQLLTLAGSENLGWEELIQIPRLRALAKDLRGYWSYPWDTDWELFMIKEDASDWHVSQNGEH